MSLNDEYASALAWWAEAGVDTLAEDAPRDWLAAAKARVSRPAEPASALVGTVETPGDLAAFRAWLLANDVMTSPPSQRLDATGDPGSGLMIVIDQPEPDDARAGELLSGEAGALLDRMLSAIGRDRSTAYLASLSPARIPGGQIGESERALLADLALRHIALVAPRALLLMGDAPSRAICGTGLNTARGELRKVNLNDGIIPAVATFHPRFLLQRPKAKAESWKDLQILMGVLA